MGRGWSGGVGRGGGEDMGVWWERWRRGVRVCGTYVLYMCGSRGGCGVGVGYEMVCAYAVWYNCHRIIIHK